MPYDMDMAKTAQSTMTPAKPKARHDDGKRYKLYTKGTDRQVYIGDGVSLERAEDLARMLVHTPEIRLVEPV